MLQESQRQKLISALVNLFESQKQAEYDFCGEQREWHLPRLNNAVIGLMEVFPRELAEALEKVKTPFG